MEIALERLPIPALILADAVIVESNHAACMLLARTAAQLSGARITDLVHPEDEPMLSLALQSGVVDRIVVRLDKTLSGTALELTLAHVDDWYQCLVARDVTELLASRRRAEELQAQLRHQALHDSLTGLPNRARLRQLVDEALNRHRRFGYRFGVMFVDLDGFKKVNDVHGHEAGDDVIRTTAARLVAAVADGATVARLGGDEFVLLVQDSDVESLGALAQRIIAKVSAPIRLGAGEVQVGCSIGIATPEPGDSADSLIGRSDDGMYAAKAEGRGRWSARPLAASR
jgi:diguanylate cyclase (GGDEF)-like protein